MSGTAATFLCAPMQKGLVQRDACAQHSPEPSLLGSSRSGARAVGGRNRAGLGVARSAEHPLGEHSPTLCIAECCCRRAGCL